MQEERVALGVRRRLRVERANRRTSSSLSRRFSAALATAGEISNWRAAADNEPLSLVWTNTWRSS